ncbi:hypothetical protein [Streptomyces vilmorinianum]|uniref:hypothetical protein n=1 Tax=Streptomyces vilmorinianum TaxID=3051092 RepID=UPI0015864457|nr:hypothetical protein [Streptomyces vilmorinianum]
MNEAVAVESTEPPAPAAVVTEPPAPAAPAAALPGIRARLALAVVPLLSLGVLGVVPSLVLALRRGTRGDWLAAVAFTAVTVGWWFQVGLTPEGTRGAQFALDVLLLFGSTVGAAVHCLVVRSSKTAVEAR